MTEFICTRSPVFSSLTMRTRLFSFFCSTRAALILALSCATFASCSFS